MMLVKGYRVTVTKAYRMDELGSHVSFEPWGSNKADQDKLDEAAYPWDDIPTDDDVDN